MKNERLKLLYNPFERIAGLPALIWGILGLALSTLLSYWSGWHYHGLLHFGIAPNPAFWCFAVEHAVVWLVPAIIFYLGGLLLSKSKIRIVDVLGTTAFALLPMIVMNLVNLLPAAKRLLGIRADSNLAEFFSQPGIALSLWLVAAGSIFLIWALVWLFFALKVSCNLKGARLIILYCIGVFGGDTLCRFVIRWLTVGTICFSGLPQDIDNIQVGIFPVPEIETYIATGEDLDKYQGIYSSEDFPLKITITNVDGKLTGQATGQSPFPLETAGKDIFKFDRAGIILEFNPTDNTMVLKQSGQIFNYIKEE